MQPAARRIEFVEEQVSTKPEERGVRFFLSEGANYFGRHASNAIVFPGGQVALYAGILFVSDNSVLLRVARSVRITLKRKPVDNVEIYRNGNPAVLEYGEIRFRVIRENDKFAVSFLTLTA